MLRYCLQSLPFPAQATAMLALPCSGSFHSVYFFHAAAQSLWSRHLGVFAAPDYVESGEELFVQALPNTSLLFPLFLYNPTIDRIFLLRLAAGNVKNQDFYFAAGVMSLAS